MTYIAGWWTLDPEGPALVNRLTGERVVLRGPASAEDAGGPGAWLRFDYEHAELRYPLLVEADPPVRGNNPKTLDLRLDHVRSARLWRNQTGASQAHPSYGTWRRVDDCVTDALACWPETGTTNKPLRREFWIRGGWLNGVWDEGMDRNHWRLAATSDKPQDAAEFTADPWLIPLDTPAPSPFDFHDLDPDAAGGPATIEDKVIPDGLELSIESRPGSRPLWHLLFPRSKGLTGFERRTVYMLSRDGRRVLYPYEATPRGQHDSHIPAEFRLLYADDDIVWELGVHPLISMSTQDEADWNFTTCIRGFGRRDPDVDPALAKVAQSTGPAAPSRALWLRIFWTISDAWCDWPGTQASCPPNWHEKLRLVRARRLRIRSGYLGGRWIWTANYQLTH